MTVLLGPADADHFRVKVGRYNDRWYSDPLPTCPIAEASEWQGPSVSATKPPFANKYVPMRAIADMPSDEWARLAKKDADERYEAIKITEKIGARLNMDRGSIVHRYAEDKLLGRETFEQFLPGSDKALEQAKRFLPALNAFFDNYQPELVACEVVCLHRTLNGVGYGGTTDAFIRIEGDVWCVDWKSRNSDHAAYGEEAGQGGAYIGAEYMIVAGPDGNPMRTAIPKVAGVLIVSIREDGYRPYPIDADGAIAHYHEMHRWWVAQQQLTANKVIGRPWAPKVATDPDRVQDTMNMGDLLLDAAGDPGPRPIDPTYNTRRARLLERYRTFSDAEKMAYCDLHIDGNDLDAVEAGLDKVDRFNVEVEPPPVVRLINCRWHSPPDEGGPVDPADVQALNDRFERLPLDAKLWTGTLIAQGNKGWSFRIRERSTVRRYEIYRGIIALAEWAFTGEGEAA